MSIQKTEAVVLKSQKLGETSKIIIMYSRKYGKIKLVAKGARGLKSRFYGTLEPLNYISVVFYQHENRDLQLLSQADIIESYSDVKNDLNKFSLAVIAVEIILRAIYDVEPNPRLFKLVIDFLQAMNDAKEFLENYLYWFELKFLELYGHKPHLNTCVFCGRSSLLNQELFFSMERGGMICSSCEAKEQVKTRISLNLAHYLTALENAQIKEISGIENSTEIIDQSEMLLIKFMEYHIEGLKPLKTIKFHDLIK
jgi:DNA repair protein RecO (recombination protein O)